MLKKSVVICRVATCCLLLLGVLGLSGVASFSPSTFAVSSPVLTPIIKSSDDGRLKKYSDNAKRIRFSNVALALLIAKEVVITEGNKKYIYPVHLLPAAISQLMLKQGKGVSQVDLDELKGPARQQFLDILTKDGAAKGEAYEWIPDKKQIQKYLDLLKPSLLKLKVLGIKVFSHPTLDLTSSFLDRLDDFSLAELKTFTWQQLVDADDNFPGSKLYFLYNFILTQLSEHFGPEFPTALAHSINKGWTPKLQTLQQAKDLALTSIPVGKKSVDVSGLVNSPTTEVSELSLEQVKILKQLENVDLKAAVRNHIAKKLDQYKQTIQASLQKLVSAKVNQLTINNKTHDIDQLLTKDNLAKSGSQLQGDARTQLLNLAKDKITKIQLDTALNQILTAREVQVQKEKAPKQKAKETKKTKAKKTALTIGLATGGGALLLAGGFIYWFYKIKK